MQLVLVDYTVTAAALELRHRASCWLPVYALPAQRDKGIVTDRIRRRWHAHVVRPLRSRGAVNKHGRRCDSGAAK